MSDYWMQTHTGGKFYFDDPCRSDIRIEDIAHALSNTGRFGGHTAKYYSVADHSVWVTFRVPPELKLPALLHDAAEAYIGDIPSPMKWYLREHTDMFDRLEWATQEAVANAFGFDAALFRHPAVKEADTKALFAEKHFLLKEYRDWGWGYDVPVDLCPPIQCDTPAIAEKRFMWRYHDIVDAQWAA